MSIAKTLQRWRIKRRLSASELEKKAGLSPDSVHSLESGKIDPPASMLESIAHAFGIPVSWLYGDPDQLDALAQEDSDGDVTPQGSVDPVVEHILRARPGGRKLFHLLAVLIERGEEKQFRVAETNLRSLIKQTQSSAVPWENRQTGNFEPPSD